MLAQTLNLQDPNYGYNAAVDKFEDLMQAGIIDPTKVLRCALENACSVAKVRAGTDGPTGVVAQHTGNSSVPPASRVYLVVLQFVQSCTLSLQCDAAMVLQPAACLTITAGLNIACCVQSACHHPTHLTPLHVLHLCPQTFLLADVVVTEIPEKNPAPAAAGGGMDDYGY